MRVILSLKIFMQISMLVSNSFLKPDVYSLDQAMGKQATDLRNISSSYDRDKKHWAVAINDLQERMKV